MSLRIADVSAEAILLAGGARAILLQLANPAVGHGVAEHSNFAERPLDRLRGTLTYLYVIVYGSPDEVRRVSRGVGVAHAPVAGARDPELQLWVAATLYDTAMRVYELVHGAVSDDDAESLLADYAVVGTTLGVPRALWPADRAAFARYWTSAALSVSGPAKAVAAALLHPRSGPWWLKAAMPTVRLVTAGLLSPDLRLAYDLQFDETRFNRLVRVARAVYPRLPKIIRHAPMRHYLKVSRSA